MFSDNFRHNEEIQEIAREEKMKKFLQRDKLLFSVEKTKPTVNYEGSKIKIIEEAGKVLTVTKPIDADLIDCWQTEMPQGVANPEEYLVQMGVKHPNLVLPQKIENIDGETIRRYRAEKTDLEKYLENGKNKLSNLEIISIMIRISDILIALHQNGVAHCDISPRNFLLSPNEIKLCDLDGSAVQQKDGEYLRKDGTNPEFPRKATRGSRFINPPELLKDSEPGVVKFDKTVDIYQAGITMYRLLTGLQPFLIMETEGPEGAKKFTPAEKISAYHKLHSEGPITTFPDNFPEVLKIIITKATAPEPKNRYQTMAEFNLALLSAWEKLSDIKLRSETSSGPKGEFIDRIKNKTKEQLAVSIQEREILLSNPKTDPKKIPTLQWQLIQLKREYDKKNRLSIE